MPRKNRYKPRKDGRYHTQVWDGTFNPDGSYHRIPLYADSSAELEKIVDDLKVQIRNNTYVRPTKDTVADYATKWFRTYKIKREINTRAMYKNIIDKHIVPAIGSIYLSDLTNADVQLMINDRFDRQRTCEQILMVMKQIVKRAERDRLIPHGSGICADIEMPVATKVKKKRPLTELEKAAIKKASLPNMEKAYIYLIFGCGLRREEALAIDTSDIDLKEKMVDVKHKIVFDKNTPILIEYAKTVHGLRRVPIPKSVFPFIQFYTKMKMKGSNSLKTPLFQMIKSNGEYITKSSYDKMWARILRILNAAVATKENPEPIHGLTGHIFRHNYATMLYYSGVSEMKAVELMGHSDWKMIREVYAHLQEEKENTKEKLDSSIAF